MHCKARGEPCLMAKMKKGWQEAALPVKSSDFNIMEQFKKIKQNFDKSKKNPAEGCNKYTLLGGFIFQRKGNYK